MAEPASDIKVVSQRDAISRCHLKNLMLAVAIECCPFRCWLRSSFVQAGRPIEYNFLAVTANSQFTTLVHDWQAYDQTTELRWTPWRIDVRLELAAWSAVDIEFVQLGFDASRLYTSSIRQKQLRDDVNNPIDVWTE